MSAQSPQSGALEVPYGVDSAGRLVSIDGATKDVSYSCPGCGSALVLRAGAIKRKHFAHAAHGDCSPESILHKTAKRLIVQAVTDWKESGAAAPCVVNTCSLCSDVCDDQMPDRVLSAREECTVGAGYRVDVGLFDADGLCAAVEVKVTHAVDNEKAAGLGDLSWIEVDGKAVVNDPMRWTPINETGPWHLHEGCGCQEWFYPRLRAYCQRIAEKTGQVLPETGFLYAPYRCWKCKDEMIVYAWESNLEDPGGEPPGDLLCPPSVGHAYSKMAGYAYHANCCPRCESIQGHFHLHAEPDGPFFGLCDYGRGWERYWQTHVALHLVRSRLIELSD